MTTTEFSQAFDVQISAYNETVAFGESDKRLSFDEYEKSVFLTRAQDELVLSFYSGKNSYGEGFEHTEEIRRYLSPLVSTEECEELNDIDDFVAIHANSHFFTLPDDLWFITYEAIKLGTSSGSCLSGKYIEVQPVTQDELHRIIKNPFRGVTKRRALRLDVSGNSVEVIYDSSDIANYTVRYVKEPTPIIVDTLYEGLDIKGSSTVTECNLHPALHKTILDRAVQMALESKVLSGGINNK